MRHPPLLLAAMLVAITTPAPAQTPPDRQGPPPGGHEPPPEAFAACADKTGGVAVTITMPDGKSVNGTCVKMADGRLAARPDKMPPAPDR